MDDEGKINRNDFLEGMARIIAVRHSFVLYLLLPTYIYVTITAIRLFRIILSQAFTSDELELPPSPPPQVYQSPSKVSLLLSVPGTAYTLLTLSISLVVIGLTVSGRDESRRRWQNFSDRSSS